MVSIFIDPPNPDLFGLKVADRVRSAISVAASELVTVEGLIVMGFNSSNSVNLYHQKTRLEKVIAQNESLLKHL